MTNNTRKPLIALVALSAALAMPLAFAQQQTEDAATQSQTGQEATGAATQTPTQSTQSAGAEGKQGWADLDVDGNGSISKQEASANAGLSQVFDQADADADGSLTAEEYKAFVSKNYDEQK